MYVYICGVCELCNTDFTLILHDREYVQQKFRKMKNFSLM